MKNSILILVVSLFVFSSCKEKEVKAIPPQPIKVVQIVPKSVPIFNEFVGQVYGEKDIPIRARVEGFLEEIHFEEGSRVKKGQLLYVIDSDPFIEKVAAEQSMVAQAKTLLAQKESDLQRVKPLAAIDAVSKRDLDMAQAERDAAISSLNAAKANLNFANINMSYTKMYSPINGVIGRTLAREGEFVGKDPNPVILNTVSDIKTIRVQFFLSENEYLLMAREYINNPKRTDKPSFELILSDGSLYKHQGEMDFIDRNIDEKTGSILLQATFPNPDGFIRPGQFARVKIKVKNIEAAILVPQKSVTELQGLYSVFIVNSENKIETKQVEVGEKIGDLWIIKKGVNAKDKVVIEGLQKIRSGMEVIPEVTEFKSQTNL
ncbi:MAG: efflux transporter periplasmic adaptor subunit [Flavobacteriaceae bacterium]|nr:MAG: efflux transporter periplasmic adaptor subunit [Flavobacteriaceae bacterium]